MAKSIDFTAKDYRNACWTVAALVNDEVVAFKQFDVESGRDLDPSEVRGAIEELAAIPEMQEEDDLPEDLEERMAAILEMDEEDLVDRRVVLGMVSGGQFTYMFTKNESKRAGIAHL